MSPEALIGMLAELERIRELTLNLIERETPRLLPAPPDEPCGTERTVFDLLLGARRAVLGNPAAARGLHDLLVAEGRRYANTSDGEPPTRLGNGEPQRSRRSGRAQRRP
jgi:hypothetical protein